MREHQVIEIYHSRELSASTMRTWLAVSAKTGNLGQVELELVLQPVDCITRTTSKYTNQIITGEFSSL